MNRPRIAAIVLAVALTSGCEVTKPGLAKVSLREQRAETAIESLEAIEAPTAEQAALLVEFRRMEAQLEKQRKAFEAIQAPELLRSGLEAGKDAATGNWFGLLEGVIALGAAAAAAFGGKALSDRTTGKKLTDLEDRLDRTLAPQGIAGLKSSSAEKAASDVARAAHAQRAHEARQLAAEAQKAAYDAQRMAQLDALQAANIPPYSAPIAPIDPADGRTATEELLARIRSELPLDPASN